MNTYDHNSVTTGAGKDMTFGGACMKSRIPAYIRPKILKNDRDGRSSWIQTQKPIFICNPFARRNAKGKFIMMKTEQILKMKCSFHSSFLSPTKSMTKARRRDHIADI